MKSSQTRLSSSTNKEEEWVKFVLKFKAIVDERGYVCILKRSETVPAEKATLLDMMKEERCQDSGS